MKHRVSGRKFSRDTKERKVLFLSLVRSLVEKGVLITTLARAKTAKRLTEKLVTLGKKNTVSGRRAILSFLRHKDLANYLAGEIAPLFQQRQGGYLRLIHLPPRKGDAAPMAKVEWVEFPVKKMTGKEKKVSVEDKTVTVKEEKNKAGTTESVKKGKEAGRAKKNQNSKRRKDRKK